MKEVSSEESCQVTELSGERGVKGSVRRLVRGTGLSPATSKLSEYIYFYPSFLSNTLSLMLRADIWVSEIIP